MFVDKADVTVTGGRGGDGSVSFHREKYVPAGGPDGGDGGRGGSVIVRVDDNMSTLMDFKLRRRYAAETGVGGAGRLRSGRGGEDLVIRVPRGTLIRDTQSGAIIKDMSGDEDFVIAKGGRGGWGNKHFATPTRQTPRFAKPGLPGESREITLELKLLADVGLLGFPNVGKSTLLSVVTRANPKIANYHFTTLYPNLGVVYLENDQSFVMADIPGIIEGASDGAGLGHDFLRHVDRCRLLLHLVDVSGSEGRDPIEDFEAINTELREWSPELAERRQLVVASKCDLLGGERDAIERLREHVEKQGYEMFEISAVAQEGTRELIFEAAKQLAELPPVLRFEPEYIPEPVALGAPEELTVNQIDDTWIVEGEWLERLIASVNFSDYESRMFFDRSLRDNGIFERLEALGISDGDTVSMYDLEFEYQR